MPHETAGQVGFADTIPAYPHEVKTPAGLTLWDHQEHALTLLTRRKAVYLAWEMGAGKTLPVVVYIARRRPALTLIACPKAVVDVWPREFRKHLGDDHGIAVIPLVKGTVSQRLAQVKDAMRNAEAPRYLVDPARVNVEDLINPKRRVIRVYGSTDIRNAVVPLNPASVVLVCNYDAVWRAPLGDWLLKNAHLLDLVVCDEIHRIKSPSGKASRFFARLAAKNDVFQRVGLSGTPMPHSPLDIYAQLRFLAPEMFGSSFVQFRNKYMRMGGYMVNNVGTKWLGFLGEGAEREFNGHIGQIMHQIKKEEVLDLPDTVHVERYVQLDAKARKIYESLKNEFIAEVESGVVTAANAMVKILRLGQIASGFATTEEGSSVRVSAAKQDLLADLLEDIDPAEPVVVFARFRRDIDCIREAAGKAGREVAELSGRQNDIGGKWAPEQPGMVAAVQIQAGAEGIDLTAASKCVYFSPTFDNGKFQQSLARVHRPGQTKKVTFIHLLAERTVDVQTYRALQQRQDIVEGVLAALRNHEE